MFLSARKYTLFLIVLFTIVAVLLLGYCEKRWSTPTYGYQFCELFEIELDGRRAGIWLPNALQLEIVRESVSDKEFICTVTNRSDGVIAIFWDREEFSYSGYRFKIQGNTMSYMGYTELEYKKIK